MRSGPARSAVVACYSHRAAFHPRRPLLTKPHATPMLSVLVRADSMAHIDNFVEVPRCRHLRARAFVKELGRRFRQAGLKRPIFLVSDEDRLEGQIFDQTN